MDEKLRKQYCELLSKKIVSMFSVTKEYADCFVQNSAIQNLLDEIPDYVDHVPLEEWAYEVYNESLRRKKYTLVEAKDMAEFCKRCFIETFCPNAYDRHHIVMSEDNEFCEGCMDCVPYVDHIDASDSRPVSTAEDFARTVVSEKKAGHEIACVECGAIFEDDDLAFAHETGECPYCHRAIEALWVK